MRTSSWPRANVKIQPARTVPQITMMTLIHLMNSVTTTTETTQVTTPINNVVLPMNQMRHLQTPQTIFFVWTQPLLDYLIRKFSSTGAININEDSVTKKIGDFVLDGNFPKELIPKLKSCQTMFTMEEQSHCNLWIKEIAPFAVSYTHLTLPTICIV